MIHLGSLQSCNNLSWQIVKRINNIFFLSSNAIVVESLSVTKDLFNTKKLAVTDTNFFKIHAEIVLRNNNIE